ncbi:ComEA family DNA-binding protein [Methylotenera sp. G11]|uniref:ComEA family DNA-binding protein n=1 Tax=Methylotenera sp. G11 TaxID=1506585 RepID=UPI0009DE722A|nr:ComEA family DNA-binding protein [Methylotenera sp. G11]
MKKVILALIAFLSVSISAIAGVNINTATQAELESLPGIGPKKAQAIIDYRKTKGNFKSVDDLNQVDGIGDATLESLRKDISITGPTTAIAPKAKKAAGSTKDAKTIKAAASVKTTDVKAAKDKPKQ